MPAYAYRCRECGTSFDVHRSMTDRAATAPTCPSGHADTSRVWAAVAVTGRGRETMPAASPSAPAGGCCGGGCCS